MEVLLTEIGLNSKNTIQIKNNSIKSAKSPAGQKRINKQSIKRLEYNKNASDIRYYYYCNLILLSLKINASVIMHDDQHHPIPYCLRCDQVFLFV